MKPIIYKDIKQYYFIDEYGNVYSNYTNKLTLLKYAYDKDGYKTISLQLKNNKRGNFRINRLVALMFLPNPNNLPVVDHIDNDKANNHISNLQWLSISDNTLKGYKYNDYHYKKRINVIKDNNVVKTFNTVMECAKYYNVSYYDISKIANKKIKPYKRGKIGGLDFEFNVEKCID